MADETKRVIDQTTDTSLSAGDFVIVDSQSEGTRKFDLGTELTGIKQDLAEINGVPNTVRQAIYTLLNNGGFADIGLTDEIAIIQEWANTHATAIALSQSSISFTEVGTQQLTAIVTPSDTTDVVYWESSDSNVAVVSSSGLVTSIGNGSCVITASVGGCVATCSVSVSGISRIYTVANVLTKAVSSNNSSTAGDGTSYSATISGATGYIVSDADIVVTMGGDTLVGVVSNGVITIPSVSGNIVITARGTLKGTNYMTNVNTTNWNKYDLTWSDVDGADFTGTTSKTGISYGVSMIQKSLSIPSNELNGKTLFCEFDVEDMDGSTSETNRVLVSIAAFDRTSPTSGSQRKGSKDISAYEDGHYSLEIPVSETEIQLSASYYFGLMIYFVGPIGYTARIKNLVYTYY